MSRSRPVLVLAIALIGVSFAGPLVRLSNAHALTIAVWRLGCSLLLIGGFLLATKEWQQWRGIARSTVGLAVGAGVLLALHFWAWNASIHLTTIAASVTLVSLQPAFAAMLSGIFLREAPTRAQIAGISVAILGAVIIAAPNIGGTHGAVMGNLLALSAALTAAGYYTVGRRLRANLGVWAYAGLVYSACFLTLLGIAFMSGVSLDGQPPRELAIFAGLAIGPMLLGHTGMNWALKYLPAHVVSLVVLGEPVGATLLGMILPGIREIPDGWTVLGGAITLTGVIVAMYAEPKQSSAEPSVTPS